VALFDDDAYVPQAPERRMSRGMIAGTWALAVAMVVLLALTFLPTSYVIQRPGPVYNTLGSANTADGGEVPLISVDGAETHPTAGALDLLTVQVVGNRERTPSWFELALAWFDPSRAVVPIESVFPEGQSLQERSEESTALMVDSQKEATAAALTELGYEVDPHLTVYSFVDDSAAAGILEEGDVILAADGTVVEDADTLRSIVNDGAGDPVALSIERDGEQRDVEVEPRSAEINGEETLLLGITLMTDYEFPFDVTIQLDNVGGPSAGMMFALGIIDVLTPGELNGGEVVAGTGTISGSGDVGPIGGIRQKMWGAVESDATWFLAPADNCDEVVGHIPGGLQVFSIETLEDALAVLDAVAEGGDTSALPTCED
jgi:PDZ domain-containing protein